MLAVSGLVLIHPTEQVQEKAYQQGAFFNFIGLSKHPTQEKRVPYKVSIYVPIEFLRRARDVLKPGEMIQIRHGDLSSLQTDTGAIYTEVKSQWRHIERLTKVPSKEKQ